jgi:hypothetical protein
MMRGRGEGEGRMAGKVHLRLELSVELDRLLEEMAEEAGITKSDVLRQAMALLLAARDGRKRERHLGFVSDPRKLETEIVGLL